MKLSPSLLRRGLFFAMIINKIFGWKFCEIGINPAILNLTGIKLDNYSFRMYF